MEGYVWLPVMVTVSRETCQVTDITYDWCPVERVRTVIRGLERIGNEILAEKERAGETPGEAAHET